MSKIHNHIIPQEGTKPDYQSGMLMPIEQNTLPIPQEKNKHMEQPPHKSSLSASRSCSDNVHPGRDEDENFRFSRFEPWHLTHMVQNIKIERQTEENRLYAEKNLQQFNSNSEEEEYYFFTPVKPESSNVFDKKTGILTSSKKKTNVVNAITERKIRPKEKGLRKLSGKAFQIVKELGQATYKTVAMRLIKEIQEDDLQADDDREENNIKRRVYDALNVLIAMGILQKRGRIIVYEQDAKVVQQQNINLQYKEERQKLYQEQREKLNELSKKKEELKVLHHKIKSLNHLINRNKFHIPKPKERIHLPFVCLQVSKHSLNLEQSGDKAQLKIITPHQYSFFGDIEFLLKHPMYKFD